MNKQFMTAFSKLSQSKKFLIFNTLIAMEHNISKKDISIKDGINITRITEGLSENGFIEKLDEEYKKLYEITRKGFSIRDTFNSMLKNNSRGSHLYDFTLESLGIDEDTITDLFFSSKKFNNFDDFVEYLFSTLYLRDKKAMIYLVENMDSDFNIDLSEKNTGIATDDNLPF